MPRIETRGNHLDWLLNHTSPASGRDDHMESPVRLSGPDFHRTNGQVAICLIDNEILEVSIDAMTHQTLRQPDGRVKLWGWCAIELAERLTHEKVKEL